MARRRGGRHARIRSRFTPRRWLPFLLLLAVVGGAVYVIDRVSPPVLRDVTVTAPETLLPVAAVADPVSSTWFCGGGTAVGAGERADLSFTIANAADTGAKATVTVFGGDAKPKAVTVDVPVNGRVRVGARDVSPGEWAAATVEVFGGRATVERQVDGEHGFEVSPCASAASNRWYLPSGTTLRGATLHLALFNPFPDPTSVDISFATDEGPISPRALTGMAVPARSLRVVTVENPSRRAEVATTITTRTGRIVVDRLQIYDGTGDSVAGSGANAVSTEAPRGVASTPALATASTQWFFPDVRFVQGGRTQLAVLNPSSERAELELTAGFADPRLEGPIAPIEVVVGPRRQTLVDLTDRIEFTPGMELTLRVRSTNDVDVAAELVWHVGERDTQPEPSEGNPDAAAESDSEPDPDTATTTSVPATTTSTVTTTTTSAPSGSGTSNLTGAAPSTRVGVAVAAAAKQVVASVTTTSSPPSTVSTTETPSTTSSPDLPVDDERIPETDPDAEHDHESEEAELSYTVYAPGYAVTAGAPVAARSWFLAGRGASEVITSQVVVANPSDLDVKVTVHELVGGARQPRPSSSVTVPAGGRATLDLGDSQLGSALVIAGDGPIVVARTQWATTGRGISTDLATPFPDQVVPLPPG